MKNLIATLFLGLSLAQAGLVNGIAVVVNNEPITLFDIDQEMVKKNISKKEALSSLINELIYNQQLKKNGISVDIFDIDNYIAKLAAQNKMKPLEFKALVRQQQDYNAFVESIKKQLTHQKLIRKVAGGNIKIATDDDMKIYYENNKALFHVPDTIEVTAYVAKSKSLLAKVLANPMMQEPEVMVQNISFKFNEINPQVRYILQNTKEQSFSSIFAQSGNYNMFFVKEKKGIKILPFEQVKESIFQTIMEERESNFLNDYFEEQKITTNVKIYR